MSIPALTEHGLLPPGVHACTLDEIVGFFGTGETRPLLCSHLRDFLSEIRGYQLFDRVFVDGGFVTAKKRPKDIDVVLVARSTTTIDILTYDVNCQRLFDTTHAKVKYSVDCYPCPSGQVAINTTIELYQTLRIDDARELGVDPSTRKGILEVAL